METNPVCKRNSSGQQDFTDAECALTSIYEMLICRVSLLCWGALFIASGGIQNISTTPAVVALLLL